MQKSPLPLLEKVVQNLSLNEFEFEFSSSTGFAPLFSKVDSIGFAPLLPKVDSIGFAPLLPKVDSIGFAPLLPKVDKVEKVDNSFCVSFKNFVSVV